MFKSFKMKAAAAVFLCAAACVLIWLGTNVRSKNIQAAPLKATLLKVGKADAIVIQCKGKTMVIDAGEEEDGEEVVIYLENRGIKRVDNLIITHFDKDHVGGADTVVEKMEIGEVILPAYEGNSTDYADFMDALSAKKIVPKELVQPMEFELGEAAVLVEPPLSYETGKNTSEVDNNLSLITTVTHGENKLLFTGDAEKRRIREWIGGGTASACDFMKLPHHGVYNTALKELLEAVTPKYAAICSSNKNPAETKTLELLKQNNVQALQTKDGDVTVISDGSRVEIDQELEL